MGRYQTDLRARAKRFAIDVYRISQRAREAQPGLRHASEQLFNAASSIGANLAESDGLNTRKELAARYAIALREARETLYWLDLVEATEPSLISAIAPLSAECKEFIAMLTTALRKLRT